MMQWEKLWVSVFFFTLQPSVHLNVKQIFQKWKKKKEKLELGVFKSSCWREVMVFSIDRIHQKPEFEDSSDVTFEATTF